MPSWSIENVSTVKFNIRVKAKTGLINFLGYDFGILFIIWRDDPTLANENTHMTQNTLCDTGRKAPSPGEMSSFL